MILLPVRKVTQNTPQTLSRWLPLIFFQIWRLQKTHIASNAQTLANVIPNSSEIFR